MKSMTEAERFKAELKLLEMHIASVRQAAAREGQDMSGEIACLEHLCAQLVREFFGGAFAAIPDERIVREVANWKTDDGGGDAAGGAGTGVPVKIVPSSRPAGAMKTFAAE